MQYLDLAKNFLTNNIPAQLWSHPLQHLDLSGNSVGTDTGTLAGITAATGLTALKLSSTGLVGDLSYLSELDSA